MPSSVNIVLGALLSLSVLTAIAVEYADLVRRRAEQRRERSAAQEAGRRGLVRVFLQERDPATNDEPSGS